MYQNFLRNHQNVTTLAESINIQQCQIFLPDFTLKQNKKQQNQEYRKLTSNDKFRCYACEGDALQQPFCKICDKLGVINGNQRMVKLIEQILQRKYKQNQQNQKEKKQLKQLDNLLISQTISYDKHQNIQCDKCHIGPIQGKRYTCTVCQDFDLCQKCKVEYGHAHQLKKIKLQANKEMSKKLQREKLLQTVKIPCIDDVQQLNESI